jgi:hypothetical protein
MPVQFVVGSWFVFDKKAARSSNLSSSLLSDKSMLLQILGGERKDGQLETRTRRLISQENARKSSNVVLRP